MAKDRVNSFPRSTLFSRGRKREDSGNEVKDGKNRNGLKKTHLTNLGYFFSNEPNGDVASFDLSESL